MTIISESLYVTHTRQPPVCQLPARMSCNLSGRKISFKVLSYDVRILFQPKCKTLRWQENHSDIQSKVRGGNKDMDAMSKSFLPFFCSSRSANFRNYLPHRPSPSIPFPSLSAMKTAEMVPLSFVSRSGPKKLWPSSGILQWCIPRVWRRVPNGRNFDH